MNSRVDKFDLFVIAPVVGGFLLFIFNLYQIQHPPYQFAINIHINYTFIFVASFVTGYLLVLLSNLYAFYNR